MPAGSTSCAARFPRTPRPRGGARRRSDPLARSREMVPPIRVGLLSFAHYHANFWAEVFRDSPLAEFVGIWDDEAERGQEAASKYGARFWSDLDALLAACDAVG